MNVARAEKVKIEGEKGKGRGQREKEKKQLGQKPYIQASILFHEFFHEKIINENFYSKNS